MKEEELREEIAEKVNGCTTTAELEAARISLRNWYMNEARERESELREKIADVAMEKRNAEAILQDAVAKRHGEIKESNREKWCEDRTRMWTECYETSTPQTIAAMLRAAKERGIVEYYTVFFPNGYVTNGEEAVNG